MGKKKERTLKSVVMLWLEMINGRGFHGIGNFFKNKYWAIKIIWLICVLGSVAYMCYGFAIILLNYLAYDVNTNVSTERVQSIEFPTISICNQNPFNTESPNFFLGDYFRSTKVLFVETGLVNPSAQTNFQTLVQLGEYYTKDSIYKYNLTDEQKYTISYSMDDMFISCMFNNYPCLKSDFEYWYTNSYGNCYKFNSGFDTNGNATEIKNVSTPGRKNAFRLELFVGYTDLNMDFTRSTGLKIFIHNRSDVPLTEIEGISAPTGFETDIVINQVNFVKKPFPYSDCVPNVTDPTFFDSSSYRATILSAGRYRQKYCLQVCFQEYLISKCNCYDPKSPYINMSIPCDANSIANCAYNASNEFYNSMKSEECFEKCPLECEYSEYNTMTTQATFPSELYGEMIKMEQDLGLSPWRNFTSMDKMRESIVAIQIYYQDIAYTTIIEQEDTTLNELISTIGGHIGLCLGPSFLTAFEMMELFIMIFLYFIIDFKWKELFRTNRKK